MRFEKSPGELVAEIRMERAAFPSRALLVLESLDDKKLWQAFVDHGACRILQSYGKSCSIAAIELLNDLGNLDGVLVIVDDDFDLYFSRRKIHPSVIYLDAHDVEALLIRSDAFDRLLLEFADAAVVEQAETAVGCSIRDLLIRKAAPVGRLRLHAQRVNWPLNFGSLGCFRIHTPKTAELNEEILTELVIDQLPDVTAEEISNALFNEVDCDCWYLCHGDDLIALTCVLLSGPLRVRNVGPKNICTALRLAFTTNDLLATAVHKEVTAWEHTNRHRVLLH